MQSPPGLRFRKQTLPGGESIRMREDMALEELGLRLAELAAQTCDPATATRLIALADAVLSVAGLSAKGSDGGSVAAFRSGG
jgi:hypothetical protein